MLHGVGEVHLDSQYGMSRCSSTGMAEQSSDGGGCLLKGWRASAVGPGDNRLTGGAVRGGSKVPVVGAALGGCDHASS